MAPRSGAIAVAAAVLLVAAACESSPSGSGDAEELAASSGADEAIAVTSPAFADGAAIPERFSCDGEDVSPALAWEGVPDDAIELALVVDDPDAPGGTFVHWVLFGLDPTLGGLAEGEVPDGARQARNSAGESAYKGPCPPGRDDPHRYRFTVYALARAIDARDGSGAGDVLPAIRDAAVARGQLTGTFDR